MTPKQSTSAAQRAGHNDLTALRWHKSEWACAGIAAKAELLTEVAHGVAAIAQDWVKAACMAKGLPTDSSLAGEEWISGPWAVLSYLNALRSTLDALAAGRDPTAGLAVRERCPGQVAVRVLPFDGFERLLLHGYRGDVWLRPGTTASQMRERIGRALRQPDGGGVCVVLGAGNISSIAPLDALYKLYAANRVVLLKLNPVNAYLGPLFGRAFAPLIARGYLRLCYGGANVGEALVTDPYPMRSTSPAAQPRWTPYCLAPERMGIVAARSISHAFTKR